MWDKSRQKTEKEKDADSEKCQIHLSIFNYVKTQVNYIPQVEMTVVTVDTSLIVFLIFI